MKVLFHLFGWSLIFILFSILPGANAGKELYTVSVKTFVSCNTDNVDSDYVDHPYNSFITHRGHVASPDANRGDKIGKGYKSSLDWFSLVCNYWSKRNYATLTLPHYRFTYRLHIVYCIFRI